MSADLRLEKADGYFGARAAGVTLLLVLVAFILADYFLVKLLHQLNSIDGAISLRHRSENEIGALRSAIVGLLNPAVTFSVIALMLRIHYPSEPIQALCGRFGCVGKPPKRLLLASFIGGVAYISVFFALRGIFPPPSAVTPNPANIINYGTFIEKAVFALTAITAIPVAEEFLFRGVLYQGIANSWGKISSAVCVSVAFVMLHPDNIESGYWVTHLALYVFPLFAICLREVTGTLYSSMAAHSGFNFTEIFF